MATDPSRAGRDTFALHGQRAIQLQRDGICHPRAPRKEPQLFTAWEDVTHVASSRGAFWLGTAHSVHVLPRRSFVDPEGPERLVQTILAILAERPGGAAQLSRMAAVDGVGRRPAPVRATWVLAAACVAVHAAQLWIGRDLLYAGSVIRAFVEDGELYRLVTANLLHGAPELPLHLLLNMVGLAGLGTLVERALGPARTVCAMGASGTAAMLAGGFADPRLLVGSSGIVFGLMGALLWLELAHAERLPVWLRVPRRTLWIVLLANAVLMVVVPFISGAAHVGGFVAGLGAAALLSGHEPGDRAPPAVRALCGATLAVALLALGAAGFELFGRADFGAHYSRRLALLPGVEPLERHRRAVEIADAGDATRSQLEAALLLAERAADETGRARPELLETVARVHFLLGHTERAVTALDEAIALAPGDERYRQLRLHFLQGGGPLEAPDAPLPEWLPPFPERPADGAAVSA